MNAYITPLATSFAEVRDHFVPKEHYVSDIMGRLERDFLWSRVRRLPCRDVP